MQEDEEAGVAESWQEIIFRVHQPPPAQSAEKHSCEPQHTEERRERACAWARAESTGESSHVYVHEIECELSRISLIRDGTSTR
jgi:hypothetical protein